MLEFKDPIVLKRFRGLYTLKDAALIPNEFLANSLNVSYADLGAAPFKMYSQFANQLAAADYTGRIISAFTVKTSAGTEIPLRVRDDDTNTTLEWYNSVDKTWDTLLGSLTTAKPMAFADFNTATQDGVFLCNGVMNYSFWKKAIGTVASNTATVITLNESSAATQGFSAAGGTVIVNGIEYTYTGISGATITGLSGLPTFDANEGVAEAVDDSSYSAITKFDIMVVADGRIWGARTDNVRLYYSETGVGTNFTTGDLPASPGVRDFIEGEGGITGLAAIKENIIVFKPNLAQLYKLDYPSSTTRVSISKVLRRGDDAGAVNQDGIVTIGESIFYTTTKGGIKSISLSKLTDEFDFDDETDIIRPTLTDGVFTSARATYWEKEKRFLLSFKKNSDSTYNDRVLVIEFTKDEQENRVRVLGILDWMVGAWFKYSNHLYFGGSYEPNCFKAFDGYEKGGADLPFTALLTTKRYRFSNNPVQQKEIPYIAIDGWILPGTTLNFQIEYDFGGTRAHIESSLAGTESDYIIEPQINTMGAFEMGSEPIGGTLSDIDELNYFKVFLELPSGHQPTDIQFTCYSDLAGSRWKLSSISFLVKDAELVIPKKLKKGVL